MVPDHCLSPLLSPERQRPQGFCTALTPRSQVAGPERGLSKYLRSVGEPFYLPPTAVWPRDHIFMSGFSHKRHAFPSTGWRAVTELASSTAGRFLGGSSGKGKEEGWQNEEKGHKCTSGHPDVVGHWGLPEQLRCGFLQFIGWRHRCVCAPSPETPALAVDSRSKMLSIHLLLARVVTSSQQLSETREGARLVHTRAPRGSWEKLCHTTQRGSHRRAASPGPALNGRLSYSPQRPGALGPAAHISDQPMTFPSPGSSSP